MTLLKKIPIRYKGELHDIDLVNFSVELSEIEHLVPVPIRPRLINERAMISMVNVKLRRMRPTIVPFLQFQYQHIGFRLLIEDAGYNEDGHNKGIYFLDSFTDQRSIAWGGKLLTDYRLHSAEIWNYKRDLDLRCGDKMLSYTLDPVNPADVRTDGLQETIGAIDRAYSILGPKVRMTQIVREKWPLQEVRCTDFTTNFFNTARLEGVFRVPETIYYTWNPPKAVLPLPVPISRELAAPLFI